MRDDVDDSATAVEALGEKLLDRQWRLRNLYWFINKDGEKELFKPNWAQLEQWATLGHRNIDLKVRQLGSTTGYCILWLDTALFNRNMRIGIVAHTKDDAKTIFRDKVKFAYESLPEEIRSVIGAIKNDSGELLLNNNSSIRVGVTFRSGTPNILHITEYGYICSRMPQRAEEIRTGAMQAVPQQGLVVIEATAKGRAGHFYELTQEAQKRAPTSPSDWRFRFLPWWREPTYTAMIGLEPFAESQNEREYLDKLEIKIGQLLTTGQREWYIRKWRELGEDVYSEYPSTPDEAFKQSTEGAYYGRQMLLAWQQGRVTSVPIEPGLPVETWWDIGNDTTSIWFVQRYGAEVRIVDFYQNSGEPLPHYAKHLHDWREAHGITYSRAIGPHDLRVADWGGSGESRLERAEKLGIKFEIAPELPRDDGIEAVRNALSRCVFDEERAGAGIKALESYRKKWNEVMGIWSDQPLHDWASHPADAFRYGVLSMSQAPSMIVAATRSVARKVVRKRWK
jgi:hypothetical protein